MTTEASKRWRGAGVVVGVLAAVAVHFALKNDDSPVAPTEQRAAPPPAATERRVIRILPAPSIPTVSGLPQQPAVASVPRPTPSINGPDYFRVSKEDAGVDEALPFGASIPMSHTPREFEKVAFRAARECGMALDVVALDCSEFPCLVWTVARNDNVALFSMEGCAPWESAFKEGTVVVGAISQDDGGAGDRYFSWMPALPDPMDQHIAMVRARERNEGMKQALGIR
jgi:hypothetical protein